MQPNLLPWIWVPQRVRNVFVANNQQDRFAKSLRTPVFRDISTLAAWKQTPSDTLKYILEGRNTNRNTYFSTKCLNVLESN